ncbi:alkene reductase [Nesterenkonia suensis]
MTIAVQEKLFSALSLGSLELRSRLAMAPLTRLRADDDGVPTDLQVEHYAQRASLGMIITEGTWPVREGRTWTGQPGIETQAHIDGWKKVTEAVHAAGGTIVLQIMHGGRISHELFTGTGRIVAPSALAAPGEIRTPEGKKDHPVPHALTADEIPDIIDAFVQGARHAVAAGFDGVQIHGANGYLLHQFTSPTSNLREDTYGGSPENRARLSVEVTRAVAEAIGAERTSIRLSPQHDIQGALESDDADALATYTALAEGLAPLGLSFVDVLSADLPGELVQTIRRITGAPLVGNSGFAVPTTREEALRLLAEETVDVVAVGRAAIANPDLLRRWEEGLGENETRPETFYAGGARGYTDYPAWQG